MCDQHLLVGGTRYYAIPILSLDGIHDVYLAEGTMNGDQFVHFLQVCLLPNLLPFNGVNPGLEVIMDNASIHHVEGVRDLIEVQAGAKLLFLSPYSPDLMPVEDIFSQVKSLMKQIINFLKHAQIQEHTLHYSLDPSLQMIAMDTYLIVGMFSNCIT